MQFRKKPVVIDAVKFSKGKFVGEIPDWMDRAVLTNKIYRKNQSLFIKTLEGEMEARDGDWIIQGVAGEIYPCKPDIFVKTYEPL